MQDLNVDYFICSHDQKSDVASHFNHLDPRNVMVSLMMMLASCNSNANISDVTCPEKSCFISFEIF